MSRLRYFDSPEAELYASTGPIDIASIRHLGICPLFGACPGTFAGLVPWWISRWRVGTSLPGWPSLQLVGVLFIAGGVLALLDSFTRFALQGLGTPAPVFPTRRLVVTGLYRHVRNPMYVAVVAVTIGQGLLFGNVRLLQYAALVWFGSHLFVLMYEEPTLRAAFGPEYKTFCACVPRWIPRLTPWHGHKEAI